MNKNIYLLPTIQKTDLLLCRKDYTEHKNTPNEDSDVKGNLRIGYGEYANIEYYQSQNLYITSDEEIKVGDKDFYIIANDKNELWINQLEKVIECKIEPAYGKVLILNSGFLFASEGKKIILTTDQDLTKDGVQAIDDEFLEWFVNNQNCDVVEIDKKENLWFCCDFFEEGQENYCINLIPRCPKCNTALGGNPDWTNYKIIIPKKESKQETLEEAAERLYPIILEDNGWDKNKQYRDE